MTDEELLAAARIQPSNIRAKASLANALRVAGSYHRAAMQRSIPTVHNEPLEAVRDAAQELERQLLRLRLHQYPWSSFWNGPTPELGPIVCNQVERGGLIEAVQAIPHIAQRAMMGGTKPSLRGKQNIVNVAALFFKQWSTVPLSGTPDGVFGQVARAFFERVTNSSGDKLDIPIRRAAARLNKSRPKSAAESSY